MINQVTYWLVVILLPVLFRVLSRKVKVFNFVGVTISCFLGGMLMANLLGANWVVESNVNEVNNIIVPIGIILMLFTTHVRKWLQVSLKVMLAYILSVVSVMVMVCGLFLLYGSKAPFEQISPLLTGTYIGGSPNMPPIQLALGIPNEIFNQIFLTDIVSSSIYLVFIMVFAHKLLGYILPKYQNSQDEFTEVNKTSINPRNGWLQFPGSIILSIFVFAIPIVFWLLWKGSLENMDMVFVILSITILSVALSFIPLVRNNVWNYRIGDYLFAVFFTTLGTLTSFQKLMDINITFLSYNVILLFGAVIIHILLCRIFKIDRDTMIISSAAGIMSPPFIPAIANAIKNKDLLVPGIAVGIMGLAIGNIMGIAIGKLLMNLI